MSRRSSGTGMAGVRTGVMALSIVIMIALTSAPAGAADGLRLRVTFDGHGAVSQHATMNPCPYPGEDPNSAFCWFGDATETTTFNSWHVVYVPVAFDASSNLSQADSLSLDWSDHLVSHFDDHGSTRESDCVVQYTNQDPATAAPQLLVSRPSGGAGLQLNAEAPYAPDPATARLVAGQCDQPYAFPDLAPPLQSLLTAVATVPPSDLENPVTEVPVSSADQGVAQLPLDCTGAAQAGTAECDRTLQWSGKLKLEVVCDPASAVGSVTFSEGQAPAVGAAVCLGQKIKTGPKSRAEITFKDGSVLRLAPESELELENVTFTPDQPRISAKLVLGNLWAKVTKALGAEKPFDVAWDRAVAGVRGSAATITTLPGHERALYHVVEGTGFVKLKGRREFDFPAGEGIILTPSGYQLTTAWPAAARALVPPGDRPPTVAALKLAGAGPAAILRVRLDQSAVVVMQVLEQGRVLATLSAHARRGTNMLRALPRRLAPGRYVLRLTVANRKRDTTIATLPFTSP